MGQLFLRFSKFFYYIFTKFHIKKFSIKYLFLNFKISGKKRPDLKVYSKICKLTDQILRDHNYDNDVLAINFLSPVRADIYSSNINQIMLEESFLKFFLTQIFGFLIIFIKLLVQFFNSIKYSILDRRKIFLKKNFSFSQKDTLIITHADKISQISDDNDLYYGKRSLHNADFCVLDKTGKIYKYKTTHIRESDLENIYLVETINFGVVFSLIIYKRMFNLFFKLFKYWFKEPSNRLRIILLKESLSQSTFLNISIPIQIKKFLKNSSYKRIISTWEGYPWERILSVICKKKQIDLSGYIHAGPFPTQHAAHRDLPSEFNPKMFLTPTTVAQKLLKKYYSSPSTVVGSHKLFGIKNKKYIHKKKDKNSKKLLLLPQGTHEEVLDLCRLAFSSTLLETEIIIRLHPALINNINIINMIRRLQKNSVRPDLISLSKRSLEEDLMESTYFLYRGSTSAVEAACYGLTPIYFKSTDPFNSQLNSLDGINLPKCLNISRKSELEEIISKSFKFDISDFIKNIYENDISFNIS